MSTEPTGDRPMPGDQATRDAEVRAVLLDDRLQTAARADAMSTDLDHVVAAAALVAIDDEHDPEGSTIAFDRAQLIAVLDQARRHLDELDEALARLDDGTYGVCVRCGAPIGSERLAARPAAPTCISCAALGPRR